MKIQSLVDYTVVDLLFDVHPFVTRKCNICDEAILVLLVHTQGVNAIVIPVCSYTEIQKKFRILIILNITILLLQVSLLLLLLLMMLLYARVVKRFMHMYTNKPP